MEAPVEGIDAISAVPVSTMTAELVAAGSSDAAIASIDASAVSAPAARSAAVETPALGGEEPQSAKEEFSIPENAASLEPTWQHQGYQKALDEAARTGNNPEKLWVSGGRTRALNPRPTSFDGKVEAEASCIGFHVSIAGSIDLAVDRALEMGCTTFQVFTRNPRGWAFKPLERGAGPALQGEEEQGGLREGGRAHALPPEPGDLAEALPEAEPGVAQGGDGEVRRRWGWTTWWRTSGLTWEKGRWRGSRTSSGRATRRLAANPGKTVLLVETMAGQNHSVGSRFEELRLILDGVKESERMGVCFDTCHVFAAGFDLSSKPAVERTMGMFEDVVGKERLKVVHLNDSKGPCGSGLDRHEYVGHGQIGEKGFRAFLRYGDVAKLPLIMEVPVEEKTQYEENLRMARRLLGA